MKIVFIGGRDIHKLGGIENYTFNLATQLVLLGHTPIVYCESDHNAVETVNGFEVRYIKCPSCNLLCKPWAGLVATLRTVCKDKGVDLIHYNAWPPSIWNWVARLGGIPSLMEGHGLEWQRSKYSPFQKRILKFMEKLTASMNRHLIMCSEAQVRYFKDKYNRDSVCIPTAVNIPSEVADTDILEKYSLRHKGYFLFMGRLVQDKNPDYLIKSFKSIRPEGYKLVIAGDNDAQPQYVSYLRELAGEDDSIVLTGAVYGQDKETLLRNAFCFCIPSTIEGLSIALLEAMAHKLPIIASDIEANREVLREDSALWVNPEDVDSLAGAIGSAARDIEKLDSAVEANFNRASSEYTWEKVTEKYIYYIEKNILQKYA